MGGHGLVLLAAVLWGTTGTAQQFAPVGATPWTIGAIRLVVGGLALGAVLHFGQLIHRLKGKSEGIGFPGWHPALLGAAVGAAGYQAAFFAGVARIGVAAGTLVTIGSAPVWAGLLEMVVLKRPPTGRWAAATGTAVLGCALLIGGSPAGAGDFFGMGLTLMAGASFALYTVCNKMATERFPGKGDFISAAALLGGGVLLLPALIVGDLNWLTEARGMVIGLHLGVLATALPYLLFGRGLALVSAASATTLTLAEPLTAAILGIALLGEQLGPVGWAGSFLILLGLLLITGERSPKGSGRRGRRSASAYERMKW